MPKIVIFDDFGQKPFFPLPKFRVILDLFFTIFFSVALQYEIFRSCKNDHFWVTKKITILTPFFHFLHFLKNRVFGSFLGHFLDHFFDPFWALIRRFSLILLRTRCLKKGSFLGSKMDPFLGYIPKTRTKAPTGKFFS